MDRRDTLKIMAAMPLAAMTSKQSMAMAETLPLGEALREQAPLGIIFHARCGLQAVHGRTVRLVDGASSIEVPIAEKKVEAVLGLVGSEVVASLLLKVDQTWRALAVQSHAGFEHWYDNRGVGKTVETMFAKYREMFDRLLKAFPD